MERSEARAIAYLCKLEGRVTEDAHREDFWEIVIEALSDKGYEIGYRDGWQKCAKYAVKMMLSGEQIPWKEAFKEGFEAKRYAPAVPLEMETEDNA